MPEGPEVFKISKSLHKALAGKQLIELDHDDKSRYAKQPLHDLYTFRSRLPAVIERVYSRGKKIVFQLSNGCSMVSSLMMEGHWVLKPEDHSNLWIKVRAPETTIWFDDSRHFGTLELQLNEKDLAERLSQIGPDLIEDDVRLADWMKKVRNGRIKNKQICDFMLEQKYFAGIGNIYRADILYLSRIRPDRTLSQITDEEHARIFENTIETLHKSCEEGGCTVRSYWGLDGTKGNYQPLVYGKTTCPQGHAVTASTFKDGRTCWWCSSCQS